MEGGGKDGRRKEAGVSELTKLRGGKNEWGQRGGIKGMTKARGVSTDFVAITV